jgi:8-amino-7-oxononanoate synthase
VSASRIDEVAHETLSRIRESGTHRRMRILEGAQASRMVVDGANVLLFAGSNYLDLAHHPEVVDASARAARDYGCAAGGSRLITGNLDLHEKLEAELASFFGTEAALAFNTGYMANAGVIPALVGPDDAIVSDELNHASIIDGARLSRARVCVFRHGDLESLARALADAADGSERILLAIDGIFSMDGDLAPLREMVDLAKRYDAMVLVDDAHGTGALGARGRGSAEHLGVTDGIDVLLGTLGKSLGGFGAFVAGSHALRELLVNVARSFIFSCALAPPQVEAARAALQLIDREPWRRWRLQENAARLRARLARHGISSAPSDSHIVPVVIGDNAETMAICETLIERGFYAQGIRHPSVPPGTARLRITPMASHSEAEIDGLADCLAEIVSHGSIARDGGACDEKGNGSRGGARREGVRALA